MDTNTRRKQILKEISNAHTAISASALASKLGVSRQVIVGDVAVLRAMGHDITSTSRGYVLAAQKYDDSKNQYLGTIVCRHTADETKTELYEIVDLDGIVVNVIVEHDIYGNITGPLNLKTRGDVDNFIARMASSRDRLLLELSAGGVHKHTIACRDKGHFEDIVRALEAKQLLLRHENQF